MTTTRITTDIDYDKPGKQISFLRLPYSDNAHAFGFIPIPVAVIANGEGPTVLLVAGTHGDEYEGQAVLRGLIHELDPADVSGRLIFLPAHNYLAVEADSRCWPDDNHNMNRVFPGDPDGTPTLATAHYVENFLLPLCDFGVDLHSGGKTSEFLPCVYLRRTSDRALMERKLAATEAFGAPLATVVAKTADNRSLLAAGDRHAIAMISTELRGMGSLSIEGLRIGRDGVRNLLRHLGVLRGSPEAYPPPRYVEYPDQSAFTYVATDGLFEPAAALGDEVQRGQLAGRVHSLKDASTTATDVLFQGSGTVVARRVPAPVQCGDYVFAVAAEVNRSDLV